MMCSMLLQMRVDGLFPPGSYRVKTKKCNYRRRLLRALAAGGTGHLAGGGRCSWDPHALKRRMRLRAIWAARCGKSKSAAADEVSTAGSPEGPSGDEVPRAFSGELAVGPASCGCWPVPAEESTGEEHVDLRSVLQKFALPGQGPSFRSADDEGGEAAAGGQSFTNDETIQDMPFAGSLVVASKNDDQDPQRAKICCDGRLTPKGLLETRPAKGQKFVVSGPLSPKVRLETRPEKGPRSHELSFLNPSPDGAPTVSPQRAPTSLPPASQCASHGFESMLVCLGLRAEDFAFDGSWCEDDPVTQTSSKDSAGHSCLARCQGLFAESCAFDSEPAVDLQVCKQELRDSIEWCRCDLEPLGFKPPTSVLSCPGLFGEQLAECGDDGPISASPTSALGFSASSPLGGLIVKCLGSGVGARCIAQDCPGLFGEMLADNSDDRAQFDLSTVLHDAPARLHTEVVHGFAGPAWFGGWGPCSGCPGLLGELLDGAWPDPIQGFSASSPLGGSFALCHRSTALAEYSARGCPGLLGELLVESNDDCATGAIPAPTLGFSASFPLGGLQVCALEADDSWNGGPFGLLAEVCAFRAEVTASAVSHEDHVRLRTVFPNGFAGLARSKDPGNEDLGCAGAPSPM